MLRFKLILYRQILPFLQYLAISSLFFFEDYDARISFLIFLFIFWIGHVLYNICYIIRDVDFYYDEKWRLGDMLLFIYLCFTFLTVLDPYQDFMQRYIPKLM